MQALLLWRDAALPLQDYVTMPSAAIRLVTFCNHIHSLGVKCCTVSHLTPACSATHSSLSLPNHLVAFARNVDGDLLVLDAGAVREWSSGTGAGALILCLSIWRTVRSFISCAPQGVLSHLPFGFCWSDFATAFLRESARCSTIVLSSHRKQPSESTFKLRCTLGVFEHARVCPSATCCVQIAQTIWSDDTLPGTCQGVHTWNYTRQRFCS
jgi:hypothetical protein